MIAYHFTADKLRDGSPIPKKGEWLVHKGELKLCASGLHASIHPFDALQYAPGAALHLVELGGKIIEGDDKVVAEKRKILKTIDVVQLLREFARKCALDVYDKWGNEKTDPDGIVLRYLKTGDESLRSAAWYAAEYAAWYATTESAASYAARFAADSAAWSAADSAADSAAWSAAKKNQRRRFKQMVTKAFDEAK